MGDRYFVRSRPDGPEKGPYDIEAIRKSHENRMLKDDAIVRHENLSETRTLRDLLGLGGGMAPPGKERALTAADLERRAENQREDDRAYQRHQAEGNSNMIVGVVMIVAGLGLTAASFSASGGGGVLFIGLVVFGFLRIIRGAGH